MRPGAGLAACSTGDLAGFPNGRRLGDDVVDIELRAIAEGYGPSSNGAFGLPNKSPNNLLGDGVDANDVPFLHTFPYVGDAAPGLRRALSGRTTRAGGACRPPPASAKGEPR